MLGGIDRVPYSIEVVDKVQKLIEKGGAIVIKGYHMEEIGLGKTVAHGHTPVREVAYYEDQVGIDTGAVYGGKLTLLELLSHKVYSAQQDGVFIKRGDFPDEGRSPRFVAMEMSERNYFC